MLRLHSFVLSGSVEIGRNATQSLSVCHRQFLSVLPSGVLWAGTKTEKGLGVGLLSREIVGRSSLPRLFSGFLENIERSGQRQTIFSIHVDFPRFAPSIRYFLHFCARLLHLRVSFWFSYEAFWKMSLTMVPHAVRVCLRKKIANFACGAASALLASSGAVTHFNIRAPARSGAERSFIAPDVQQYFTRYMPWF